MKHLYPSYYNRFECIAAACPDSCCQGWDVVIDSDTEAFYNSVSGSFGDKLRNAIYTDPDGDRVFRLAEEKKCPFWGADHLCDIYRELGRERLCATCALFPRITMDYTVFTEHTLSLACPEAARLVLSEKHAYEAFDDVEIEPCEAYDTELMRWLLRTRAEAAAILTASKPLADRLDDLLAFAQSAQRELTGEVIDLSEVDLSARYAGLEYIDESSRCRIVAAAQADHDLSAHEGELTSLALYWLYRYYLCAVDSLCVIAPLGFVVSSVKVAAAMAGDGGLTAAAQCYSKEIEQSYENMERLMEAPGIAG